MGGQATAVEAGAGRTVSLRGTKVTFKVDSADASGASCVEFMAAPGFDTGLHVHARLEESFYVLDGAFEFRLGEETFLATPGACVFVPPRLSHAFANREASPSRLLLTMSPAGHDRYFDELAQILSAEGAPDSDAIAALRAKYDTEQLSSLVAGR